MAAIGMAVSFGALWEATGTMLLVLMVLVALRPIDRWIERRRRPEPGDAT